jgi:hypothetical protein
MEDHGFNFEDQTSHPKRLGELGTESAVPIEPFTSVSHAAHAIAVKSQCRCAGQRTATAPPQARSQRSRESGSEWIRCIRVLHDCEPQTGSEVTGSVHIVSACYSTI